MKKHMSLTGIPAYSHKGNIDLESIARQAAEEAVLNAALDDGILVQAEINAEHYLIRLFDALGFPDVVFEFAEK